jgi:UDP-N-acetylmuramoyl-tripeptide--D-alanyl-D-alanine ligase
MRMTMKDLRTVLGEGAKANDALITGLCIDSRRVQPGDLFVALRGQQQDGHAFVRQALDRGASLALVDTWVEDVPREKQVRVADVRVAMGKLAAWWHAKCGHPTAAITGSVGKTTVKELLTLALGGHDRVCATVGNYNNDLGLPLTLATETPQHAYTVLEMGANAPGEIGYLASLAEPEVGVLTAIEPAHVAGFGSLEGVARAKLELFAALPANGAGVFPSAIRYGDRVRDVLGSRRAIPVGAEPGQDGALRVKACTQSSHGWDIETEGLCSVALHLPLPGRHNVSNALLALAAATALGMAPELAAAHLEKARSIPGRMHVMNLGEGRTLVDDTYNASPASVKAAVDWLASRSGVAVLVLGDMAELGDSGLEMHRDIGSHAREKGIAHLLSYGRLSSEAAVAFGDQGEHFESMDALQEAVLKLAQPGTTVLVKGSRSMAMERVVQFLESRLPTMKRD